MQTRTVKLDDQLPQPVSALELRRREYETFFTAANLLKRRPRRIEIWAWLSGGIALGLLVFSAGLLVG